MHINSLSNLTALPRRVPKLAARNKTPDDNELEINKTVPTETVTTPSSFESSEDGDSGAGSLARIPMPIRGQLLATDAEQKELNPSPSRSISGTASNGNGAVPPEKKKKKGKAVLAFLTLKEPSSAAWGEFAEAEKDRARQKGNRLSTVGFPGVSTRKLPNHVPKVNSKWDGLPNGGKKSTESKRPDKNKRTSLLSSSTRQSHRWSTISFGAQSSEDTTRPVSGLPQSSRLTNRQSLVLNETSTHGQSSPPLALPDQSPALALNSTVLCANVEEMSTDKPNATLASPFQPEHPITFLTELPSSPPPQELEADTVPLPELDASSASPTSPLEISPITPPAIQDMAEPVLVAVNCPGTGSPDQRYADGFSPTSNYVDTFEENQSSEVPERHERKGSINFSRPIIKPSVLSTKSLEGSTVDATKDVGQENIELSPTLKNSSGKIEPFFTDTFAAESRQSGQIPEEETIFGSSAIRPSRTLDRQGESNAIQVATTLTGPRLLPLRTDSDSSVPTSVAASEMSEQWQKSPKERLGLGGKVNKSEVLPWELAEDLPDNAEVVTNENVLPPSNQRKKEKRLSWKRVSSPTLGYRFR